RLRAGDVDLAETLARQVLAVQADNARALHLVALCEHKRGRVDEALRAFLAATRVLDTFAPGRPEWRRIWAGLNFAFTGALSGIDSALAATRRAEYAQWAAPLPH